MNELQNWTSKLIRNGHTHTHTLDKIYSRGQLTESTAPIDGRIDACNGIFRRSHRNLFLAWWLFLIWFERLWLRAYRTVVANSSANICSELVAIIGSHHILISGDGFPFKNIAINGNHNLFEFRNAKSQLFCDQYFSILTNFHLITLRMWTHWILNKMQNS